MKLPCESRTTAYQVEITTKDGRTYVGVQMNPLDVKDIGTMATVSLCNETWAVPLSDIENICVKSFELTEDMCCYASGRIARYTDGKWRWDNK